MWTELNSNMQVKRNTASWVNYGAWGHNKILQNSPYNITIIRQYFLVHHKENLIFHQKSLKAYFNLPQQSSTFKVIDTCLKRKSDSDTTLQQLLWNVTKLSHLCNYTCNLSIPLRAISFPSLTYSADRSSSMIKVWKPRQFKHLVPRLKYVARHTSTTHIG